MLRASLTALEQTDINLELRNIYESRSEKTGLTDILEFLCKKTFKKHQKVRNLTCLYISNQIFTLNMFLKEIGEPFSPINRLKES